MSIISGYRKNGFDAYNEKILKSEHMKLQKGKMFF